MVILKTCLMGKYFKILKFYRVTTVVSQMLLQNATSDGEQTA